MNIIKKKKEIKKKRKNESYIIRVLHDSPLIQKSDSKFFSGSRIHLLKKSVY